jgi:hypothetical protein
MKTLSVYRRTLASTSSLIGLLLTVSGYIYRDFVVRTFGLNAVFSSIILFVFLIFPCWGRDPNTGSVLE